MFRYVRCALTLITFGLEPVRTYVSMYYVHRESFLIVFPTTSAWLTRLFTTTKYHPWRKPTTFTRLSQQSTAMGGDDRRHRLDGRISNLGSFARCAAAEERAVAPEGEGGREAERVVVVSRDIRT